MPTAVIRMADGDVVHSCGDLEVAVPLRSGSIAYRFYVMHIEAFDFILGNDFFAEHAKILSLTLQAPSPRILWGPKIPKPATIRNTTFFCQIIP